jgi:Cu/Ag efflux pump CusA
VPAGQSFQLTINIGIVVDDAIVVVENVERWLEHGLPTREAARRAMDESPARSSPSLGANVQPMIRVVCWRRMKSSFA